MLTALPTIVVHLLPMRGHRDSAPFAHFGAVNLTPRPHILLLPQLGRLLKYVKAVREERSAVGCWTDQSQGQEEAVQCELAALAQRAAQLEHECARLAERAAAAERERDEARMQAQAIGQELAAVQAVGTAGGGLAMPPGLPEAVGALQKEMASVLARLAAVEETLNASGTPELRDNKRGMLSP